MIQEFFSGLSVTTSPEFFRFVCFVLLFAIAWWLKSLLNELKQLNQLIERKVNVLPAKESNCKESTRMQCRNFQQTLASQQTIKQPHE